MQDKRHTCCHYQIVPPTITLSDLRGHSPTTSIFKCCFCSTAVQQLTRFQAIESVV